MAGATVMLAATITALTYCQAVVRLQRHSRKLASYGSCGASGLSPREPGPAQPDAPYRIQEPFDGVPESGAVMSMRMSTAPGFCGTWPKLNFQRIPRNSDSSSFR